MVPVRFLAQTRVLLIAHYVPGPTAAYLLRCLGAEVIKVEPPFHDMLRNFPPFLQGEGKQMSAWFRALNAGFKSITVDFRSKTGPQVLRDLIRKSDVLIDGNRPGYLARVLGEEPTAVHDGLIYLPISAHGLRGPLRDVAGHDNNLMALAGNLSYTAPGQHGLPAPFSAPIADINAGYLAAFLAVAALHGRRNPACDTDLRTMDPSMLHAAFFLNQMQVAGMNADPAVPLPGQAWMNGGMANYAPYTTADGEAIFFGPIEPNLFANFARAVHREDLNALLYQQNAQLKVELTKLFLEKTAAEWESQLAGIDCCFSRVNDLATAQQHPQIQALGLVREVQDPTYGPLQLATFPAGFGPDSQPPVTPSQAPEPGEHTHEILSQILQYPENKIASIGNDTGDF